MVPVLRQTLHFQKLAGSRRVLLARAGDGCDGMAALPLDLTLRVWRRERGEGARVYGVDTMGVVGMREAYAVLTETRPARCIYCEALQSTKAIFEVRAVIEAVRRGLTLRPRRGIPV